MKILIDKNNLLVINNPNIPKLKEYSNVASGYRFSDYDKGIIIYHKKIIKIINLKNLGDNMNIFYVIKRKNLPIGQTGLVENHLDQDGFLSAFGLFNGFDENTGNKYFFIPRMKEIEMRELNKKLEKLGMDLRLEKSEKGILANDKGGIKIPVASFANETGMTSAFSFLFGLVLIYGKMDVKNGNLISIKAHIPLFGQYVKYKEELDELIKNLQSEGIFLNCSIAKNEDGIIYQINSSDYELLGSFVNYYQSVEKIQKILKQELTQKVKSELIDFIETNEQIPNDGKENTLRMIEDGVIKILTV